MPGRSGRVWQEDGHQQSFEKSQTETQRNAHPRKQDAGPSKAGWLAGWLREMSFLSPPNIALSNNSPAVVRVLLVTVSVHPSFASPSRVTGDGMQ